MIPSPTCFYYVAEPKREPPARPPPPTVPAASSSAPQNQPGGLPYPMYAQGMPVPYAAAAPTPYPTYVPPPMPQGYNPYGTLPYQQGKLNLWMYMERFL